MKSTAHQSMFKQIALVSLAIATFGLTRLSPAECSVPAGFIDTPHPAVGPNSTLVSHMEETMVARPLSSVIEADSRTDLKDAIRKSSALPGVAGDQQLGDVPFPNPGARRVVCLTDGSITHEQVLERTLSATEYHFRYIVWGYTTAQARPVEYGIGEFRYVQTDPCHTRVVWIYSFHLKEDRFPGYLGAPGRWLFRVGFLDRDYATMMRTTLQANKTKAETCIR